VCDCTNAGGDSDGDGICDNDDYCPGIFDLTNNPDTCTGDRDRTERPFQAQLGTIAVEITEFPRDARRLLRQVEETGRMLQTGTTTQVGQTLAFPNETPESFYAWAPNDTSFNGPIPLKDKEITLSLVQLGPNLDPYLVILGSYSADAAFVVDVFSFDPNFPVGAFEGSEFADGPVYDGTHNTPCFGQVATGLPEPSAFAFTDDIDGNDCFYSLPTGFMGTVLSSRNLFPVGNGVRAVWRYSGGRNDGAIIGPIPAANSIYLDGYFCFYIRKNPFVERVEIFDFETLAFYTAQGRKLIGTFDPVWINNPDKTTWVWGTCMLYNGLK